MADINLSVSAKRLNESLENLSEALENELKEAVKNLATAAYNSMVADVQNSPWMSDTNRKDYLNGLKFQTLGSDEYLIFLDNDQANKLEDGVPSYVMNPGMLASSKIVQVGSRAGQPWVRKAKDGHKYAAVPFEQHPFSKAGNTDLAKAIQQTMVQNASGANQKITQIFKDIDGNVLQGKVATATAFNTPVTNLQGLTKYQYVNPKGTVSSVYMVYRMISENGKPWIQPARPGFHLFKKAEEYISAEMDNIIRSILS